MELTDHAVFLFGLAAVCPNGVGDTPVNPANKDDPFKVTKKEGTEVKTPYDKPAKKPVQTKKPRIAFEFTNRDPSKNPTPAMKVVVPVKPIDPKETPTVKVIVTFDDGTQPVTIGPVSMIIGSWGHYKLFVKVFVKNEIHIYQLK